MEFKLNKYRGREVDGKYFVSTDHGSFCILSKDEYGKLKSNDINQELAQKLSECEIILDSTNVDETVRLTRNRYDYLYYGTSLHIIVLTLRCNMNCIYCHASAVSDKSDRSYDMDESTAKDTIDFIFQTPNNNIKIEFQGGEPILNWPILKYIIEYAQEKNKTEKKNMDITVVTNFTEMDDEKLNYLIEKGIDICSSLDGPKEVHDYNRTYVGGSNYDQVVSWIKRIQDEYKKRGITNRRPHALVTLSKKSLQYPKEIIDEYIKLGLNDVHLRFLNNLGMAAKAWSKINYSVDEYLNFWKKSVEYIEELKEKGVDIHERIIKIMVQKIVDEFDPNYLDLRSPCGAAIGQLAYNYNGDIYTCDEARMIGEDMFMLGNVHDDNYKEVVTCTKSCAIMNSSINDLYHCDECSYKPYCGLCPVINFAEQGNIIARIPETDRCKIFMEQFDWVVQNQIMKNNGKI